MEGGGTLIDASDERWIGSEIVQYLCQEDRHSSLIMPMMLSMKENKITNQTFLLG
ncbi:hypothetical protein J2T56_002469 [Natronobacillus azotifigens]|uniref:Uncharacterized protein n=1 Tax=Natronobacillus azotifigens TaxID=472978 RepID=A0A9J6RF36_9BACI|nr:hypothetical protein [Natronobacillus azotifigens]MCZ0704175.1 hypothetical protein [Natronobacillus azotifigens]